MKSVSKSLSYISMGVVSFYCQSVFIKDFFCCFNSRSLCPTPALRLTPHCHSGSLDFLCSASRASILWAARLAITAVIPALFN